MRGAPLLLPVVLLVGCSAGAPTPPPDIEGSVQARVEATIAALPSPTAAAIPTTAVPVAQSRNGRPVAVWATAPDAYLGQYPQMAKLATPRCTFAPFTDVQVLTRDSGFRFSILGSSDQSTVQALSFGTGRAADDVAQIASLDGRCAGFVSGAFLTD